ncbi:MAG: hypothetical protein GX815_13045 [Clostridiales bacterium]|nr:hypothetical protein [Clostridiales bacterium]
MEKNGNKFLKVTGILMIIGGSLGIIIGIIAVVGALGLNLLSEGETVLLVWGSVAVLMSAIVSLIAGIIGVKNAAKPEKAQICIVFGVITALFAVLGSLMTVLGGGKFNAGSLIIGLLLPVLYLIGAFQNKSLIVNVQNENLAQ